VNHATLKLRSTGFTFVELLIAMMLAVFMMFGLYTILQNAKDASTAQTNLSQQTDNERYAMTLIGEVVQSAGYFTAPQVNTASAVFTPTAPFVTSGQAISGTTGGATGDTVTIRYYAYSADKIYNCDGSVTSAAAPQIYTNQFSVSAAGNQLMCSVNGGAAVALVDNVSKLGVLYGVRTNAGTPADTIDTYLTAAQMTPAYWLKVVSIQVTVTFVNTVNVNGQAAAIPVTRTIALMSAVGSV